MNIILIIIVITINKNYIYIEILSYSICWPGNPEFSICWLLTIYIFPLQIKALVEHVDFLQANCAAKAALETILRRVAEQRSQSWDRGRSREQRDAYREEPGVHREKWGFYCETWGFDRKACDFIIKHDDFMKNGELRNGDFTMKIWWFCEKKCQIKMNLPSINDDFTIKRVISSLNDCTWMKQQRNLRQSDLTLRIQPWNVVI